LNVYRRDNVFIIANWGLGIAGEDRGLMKEFVIGFILMNTRHAHHKSHNTKAKYNSI